MSEPEDRPQGGGWARWRWNVSAAALLAAAGGAGEAAAAPEPPWAGGEWTFDLQGELGFVKAGGTTVGPAYDPSVLPLPNQSSDVMGAVTYRPAASPWSFYFDVRYGRTRGANEHQVSHYSTKFGQGSSTNVVHHEEEHGFVDFDVGRDVGLGLFGHGATTVGLGVRYAHFDSLDRDNFTSHTKYFSRRGVATLRRKSDSVGPQVMIRQSSLLPGALGQGALWFDWGATGGVLFGRQANTLSGSAVTKSSGFFSDVRRGARAARAKADFVTHHAYTSSWSGNQTTPDVSAFVQLSFRPAGSPLSVGVGYRVDAFWDVLNGAFPGRRETSELEHGPYLDVSLRFK